MTARQYNYTVHVTEFWCQWIMKVIVMCDDIIYTSVVMEPFVFPCHLEGHLSALEKQMAFC